MYDELIEILSQVTGLAPERIQPDMLLYEYCDELDVAQIAVEVEDAFGIEIADDDVYNWMNVQDIMDYIENAK
ncbi:MAG: acyl carrier protein [Lachnospiraceae bacterium]|nr:acyl carrier protein [Lachnospiraceae bacterium]